MSPQIALAAVCFFVFWLLRSDSKGRESCSAAVWIPTIWALILGSQPVSNWFGLGLRVENPDDYLEGSPADRMLFLVLMLAAAAVLWKRRVNWRAIWADNKWLAAYFLFFGVSVLWSDYPFTAFKRWVKDVGNLLMALVIVSENNPVMALKLLLRRCAVVLVPFSVLLIRFYPEIGMYYDNVTGTQYCRGVTLFKNQLGMAAALSTLYLAWEFVELRRKRASRSPMGKEVFGYFGLLVMAIWLLRAARSATAQSCAALGACALIFLSLPMMQQRLKRVLRDCLTVTLFLFLVSSVFDLKGFFLGLLGRDASLTGRTSIWAVVLSEDINPLIGTGFSSFWTGERMARLWLKYDSMVQAHNGYLETYLNGGLMGIFLLLGLLLASGRAISRSLPSNPYGGSMRFVLWFITIVYNWTEASFSKLSPLWLYFLIVSLVYYSRASEAIPVQGTPAAIPDGYRPAEPRSA